MVLFLILVYSSGVRGWFYFWCCSQINFSKKWLPISEHLKCLNIRLGIYNCILSKSNIYSPCLRSIIQHQTCFQWQNLNPPPYYKSWIPTQERPNDSKHLMRKGMVGYCRLVCIGHCEPQSVVILFSLSIFLLDELIYFHGFSNLLGGRVGSGGGGGGGYNL